MGKTYRIETTIGHFKSSRHEDSITTVTREILEWLNNAGLGESIKIECIYKHVSSELISE